MHDDHETREESKKPSRRRRTFLFLILSLANAGVLTVILIALFTPARNTGQSNDPLIGHPAPNFTLAALNPGERGTISLSDFKGKPVVLNVWSSTCAPCAEEAPLLEQQWQQVRAQGVVFLGIDFQDSQSGALKFLQQYAVTYPNVSDTTGSTTLDYGVTGMPETLFISRQGVVVSRVIGQLTPQALQSNLQAILR
jgi:cytochrome c biogenesis protein CcmG, thiol:disulfide interchange protein DsbE